MAPKSEPTDWVKTSMRLPAELWKALRIRAIEEGVDAQDMVARALDAFLKGKGAKR